MESINNNNNINFTARMDLSKINKNKTRLQNIANIFERKTQKRYPNDTFYMTYDNNDLCGCCFNSITDSHISFSIYNKEVERLFQLKDATIASKFKKMLDISAHREKIYDATKKYAEKIYNLTNKTNAKIWENANDIINKEAKDLQNKDSFLRDISLMF